MASSAKLRVSALEAPTSQRSTWRTLGATLASLSLLACSGGDTILALNVSSADDVGLIEELRVTIKQDGHEAVEHDFAPPLKEVEDAGQVIVPTFFERIKLPASWDDATAEISVEARRAGAETLHATGSALIRPGGAVAAQVELERMPKEPMSDAGADSDGSASDASVSDAGGDAEQRAQSDGGDAADSGT